MGERKSFPLARGEMIVPREGKEKEESCQLCLSKAVKASMSFDPRPPKSAGKKKKEELITPPKRLAEGEKKKKAPSGRRKRQQK